ncbi:fimbrial protein [Salmonella bongori]|nr:fimbrial protein [Salmonella bongori]
MEQEQLTILHSLKLLFSLAEQQTPTQSELYANTGTAQGVGIRLMDTMAVM